MSCGELKNAMGRYHGTTSTALYYWMTPWMAATGVDNIRAIVRALAVAGGSNFKWQLAMQACAVRQDNPDDPTLLGAEQSGAGTYAPGDISLSLAEKAWWRLGIAVRASTGVAQGDIELDYGFNDCGKVVAFTTISISSDSSSNPTIIPLGDILPANFAQKFKAAIIISSADANFQAKLMYRKGTIKATMGGWTDFSTPDSYSGSAERNTGELSISATTELFVQGGVAVKSTSGTSTGTITVLLIARKT